MFSSFPKTNKYLPLQGRGHSDEGEQTRMRGVKAARKKKIQKTMNEEVGKNQRMEDYAWNRKQETEHKEEKDEYRLED